MSLTLGIDTSGKAGSVALHPGGPEIVFEKGLIHGVALAPAVRRLLDEHGGAGEIDLVAVGLGPGSYTGVRVGVAFAKTYALAAGLEAVGVSSYDAIALNAKAGETVVVAGDARRDTFYLGTYLRHADGAEPLTPLELVPAGELRKRLPRDALVLGDAAASFGDLLSGDGRTLGAPDLSRVRAGRVARLGAERIAVEGPDDIHDLAPLYLRLSEAEERLTRKDG